MIIFQNNAKMTFFIIKIRFEKCKCQIYKNKSENDKCDK